MASCLVVVTPDKSVLQGIGLSCETGGKVLHLDYMAYTSVPPV